MKTNKIRFSILLFSSMVLFANCSSEFTYNEMYNKEEDKVWGVNSIASGVKSSLIMIYRSLQNGYNDDIMGYQDCATTNATTNEVDATSLSRFNAGVYTEANNPDDVWSSYYTGIYRANRFLIRSEALLIDEADALPESSVTLVDGYRAEAKFLKAWFYFELVRRYGAVPIINEEDAAYDPLDEGINDIQLATFDECVTLIADLCDEAYPDLVTTQTASTDRGRATKAAALALKSRMYLYAASVVSDNSDYLDACIEASLELITVSSAATRLDDFSLLFDVSQTKHTANTNEIIFERRGTSVSTISTANYPIGFESAMGNTNPTHDLVEAFYKSATGDINATLDMSASNPYAALDGDVRFESTIVYNGCAFNYDDRNGYIETFVGGLDAMRSPIEPGSKTGYYLRKYMHPSAGNLVTGTTGNQCWFYLRYAEIYMNLAEALFYRNGNSHNVIDDVAGVTSQDVLNLLRAARSASSVEISTSDEYLAFLRNERRVEFAFEGHYFFDVKRWNKMDGYTPDTTISEVVITSTDGGATCSYTTQVLSGETRFLRLDDYPIPSVETLNDFL